MSEQLKLMCVLAHPDDESLGTGGILARYASEGVETSLITATRGQRGWKGSKEDYPGEAALGDLRTRELEAAAEVLGVRQVFVLEHMDGELDRADSAEAVRSIAEIVQRVRPQVVVTFGPDGVYGHPDHIAISQLATAAVVRAASDTAALDQPPHLVSKLYYMAPNRDLLDAYQAAFGVFNKRVDDHSRGAVPWEDWALTTRVETRAFTDTVWQAISRHRSQLRDYAKLRDLPEEHWLSIFGEETYYRVFSLVNGGRETEGDLFVGLRGT